MDIEILPADHFGAFLYEVKGFSSCIQVARIVDPSHGYIQCYLKAFPNRGRGLLNEVLGWLWNHASSLPGPARGWVLLIERTILEKAWPDKDWSGFDGDTYPVWCTNSLASPAPKIRRSRVDDRYIDEIRNWAHLHATIARDEILHNVDGNAGNLVRLALDEFASLDFGEIFGGQNWTPETLLKQGALYNKLLHVAYNGTPSRSDTERIVHMAEGHAAALSRCRRHLYRWCNLLADQHSANSVLEFLDRRVDTHWMKARFA